MVNITFSTCWYNLKAKFPSEVYSQWIDKLAIESKKLNSDYNDASSIIIRNCRVSVDRIDKGINLIKKSLTFSFSSF